MKRSYLKRRLSILIYAAALLLAALLIRFIRNMSAVEKAIELISVPKVPLILVHLTA